MHIGIAFALFMPRGGHVRVTWFTLAFSMLRVFPLYGLMGLKELIVGLNV